MNDTIWLVLVIVVLLALTGWLLYERRRTRDLRSTFGPEYGRVVEDAGSRRAAEAELQDRKQRVEGLEIHPLTAEERDRFAPRWRDVQAAFVDEPRQAVEEADRLIGEVMQARGYPMADFEQRVADISVDHAGVVDHYRAAHEIATQRGDEPDTEALREAMVHYRALFDDLLGSADAAGPAEQRDRGDVTDRDDRTDPHDSTDPDDTTTDEPRQIRRAS